MTDSEHGAAEAAPHSLVLWRIVMTNPPTLVDFKSHKERGIELKRPTPDALRLWEGVSVYRDREVAVALARRVAHLGQFVAALRIPLDGTITLELDNRRNGHCTLWTAPDVLARLVIAVEPV